MAGRTRTRPPRAVAEPPDLDGPVDGDREPEADPESVARTICLRLLTARARTRSELEDALRARAVPDTAAKAVLDRFTDVGLINDSAFAETFVSSRQIDRGLASREIARQLRDRGVAPEIVDAAVQRLDPDTEFATARRLAERKLRSLSGLDRTVQQRRLAGLLARKGYTPGVTFAVIRAVLSGADVPDEIGTDE